MDDDSVRTMGRLVRIELENFKSYAGSQTIGPFQDFSAVIGPNGAGKSNLMDAISFVLGVQSRHLRSQRLEDLVFRADEGTVSKRRAMVKIVYQVGNEEVDGLSEGDEIEFSRIIATTGVSSYRLNNREVTWKMYEQRLEDIGVLVKARNFLVFQGDVDNIASKSPKELTQLFEQVSGSDAFKKDYETLQKTMESAEQEALHSMQQKKASVAERRIVKEQKEEAERFEVKKAELDGLRREYFLIQLFHLDKNVAESERNLEIMTSELEEMQQAEKKSEVELKEQKRELAGLNKRLGKAEALAENARVELAELGPYNIKLKEEVRALGRQIEDYEITVKELRADKNKQEQVVKDIEADIEDTVQKENEIMERIYSEGQHAQLSEGRMEEYEALKTESRRVTQDKRDDLEAARRRLTASKTKLEAAQAEEILLQQQVTDIRESIQQYNNRKETMIGTTQSSQRDKLKLENDLKEMSEKEEKDRETSQRLESELNGIESRLRDARAGRRESNHEVKMSECLETLKRHFPGVRGRLTSLCKPTHRRFNTAVATAGGRHMDSIVVNTRQTGFDCVKHLRMHRLGTASFIPLDSIRTEPVTERYRTLGPRFRLAVDIIQCDDDIKPAVAFAVGNTVVSDSLDDARNLCFTRGERVKCVTIQGALITKAGNITGGIGAKEGGTAQRWDEQEIQELKIQRENLRTELASLGRAHRNESIKSEIRTKLKGLQNRIAYGRADIQVCDEKIAALNRQELALLPHIEATAQSILKANTFPAELEESVSLLENDIQGIEDEIFSEFLAQVGASSVRDFEEGPLKAVKRLTKERLRLAQHKARLEAQIAYEKTRDFQKQLDKISKKIGQRKKSASEASKKLLELRKKEEELMRKLEKLDADVKSEKEKTAEREKKVRIAQAERQRHTKDRSSVGKRMAAEETSLEKLRARLHEVLQRAQVEEVDLPMRQGDNSDEEEESDENEQSANKRLFTEPSQSQAESSGPHFSQADNNIVLRDKKVAHKVDLSQLKKHRRLSDPSELDEILNQYTSRIATLRSEVERMQPNLKALDQFQTVQDKLKESGACFEAAKSRSKTAAQAFDDIKHSRRESFEDAFQHISKSLSGIYKELTRSSKHPLGGQASISLDDQEEPYNGGIKFSAMPPGKRLRDMDQLSGGERTVAALALLFAIHSYRPAPFFVMDEIDAALDNINVKKVCHFIEQRAASGLFQSIVISLKDMFYERAEALVGIYRDSSTNSSRTLTLDLMQYDEAAVNESALQ